MESSARRFEEGLAYKPIKLRYASLPVFWWWLASPISTQRWTYEGSEQRLPLGQASDSSAERFGKPRAGA